MTAAASIEYERDVHVFVLGLQSRERPLLEQRLAHLNVRLSFSDGNYAEKASLATSAAYCIGTKQCNHSATMRAKRAYGAKFIMTKGGLTRMAELIQGLNGVHERTSAAPAAAASIAQPMNTWPAYQSPRAYEAASVEPPASAPITPVASPANKAPHRAAAATDLWRELRPVASSDDECVMALAEHMKLAESTVREYLRVGGVRLTPKPSGRPSGRRPLAVPTPTPASEPAASLAPVVSSPPPVSAPLVPAPTTPSSVVSGLAGDLGRIQQMLVLYEALSPAARELVRKGLQ